MKSSQPLFASSPSRPRSTLPNFRLFSPLLEDSGIAYSVFHLANPSAPHPAFRPCLDVHFEVLTRPQFALLQATFSSWAHPALRSRVQYFPDKRYRLIDFLPAPLQALDGLIFRSAPASSREDLRNLKRRARGTVKQNVGLYFNCFGYALLALRCIGGGPPPSAPPRITISAPDPAVTYAALANDAWSHVVADDFRSDMPDAAADVRAGDYVLVYHELSDGGGAWLDHVAIVVCGNVLAEKAGSGDGTPFRLIDFETFEEAWSPLLGVFKRQVRRLNEERELGRMGTRRPLCPDVDFSCVCGTSAGMFGKAVRKCLDRDIVRGLGITHELGKDGNVADGHWTACVDRPQLVVDEVTGLVSLPASEIVEIEV